MAGHWCWPGVEQEGEVLLLKKEEGKERLARTLGLCLSLSLRLRRSLRPLRLGMRAPRKRKKNSPSPPPPPPSAAGRMMGNRRLERWRDGQMKEREVLPRRCSSNVHARRQQQQVMGVLRVQLP